jgi:hypothetical protein
LARERDDLAQATELSRQRLATERERLRLEITNELHHARQQIVAEQGQARADLDRWSAQAEQARAHVASLQKEAQGFRTRYTEYEQAVSRLCEEVDRTLPAFVTVLERTPAADADVIGQVYLLNDRLVRIRKAMSEARDLVDAGVVGRQLANWVESGWGGPQGHLSVQWHD